MISREIKFRGLNISGQWCHGNLSILKNKTSSGITAGYYISNYAGSPFAYQVRPETIGQLVIGEIYEGDIVQYYENDFEYGTIIDIGVVEWGEADTSFIVRWSGGDILTVGDSAISRILGNIHQHPNLIEEWRS